MLRLCCGGSGLRGVLIFPLVYFLVNNTLKGQYVVEFAYSSNNCDPSTLAFETAFLLDVCINDELFIVTGEYVNLTSCITVCVGNRKEREA